MSMPDNINLSIGKSVDNIISDKHIHILNGELLTGVCSSKVIG
jgi:hypothetical protein